MSIHNNLDEGDVPDELDISFPRAFDKGKRKPLLRIKTGDSKMSNRNPEIYNYLLRQTIEWIE